MKAFVLGELCEDILMHWPESVAVMGVKAWAHDITITAGGSAFYTGAALNGLGVQTAVCSVVGEDDAADRCLNHLKSRQMDTRLIEMIPGAMTTQSIVVCDSGKKDFIGCSPMLPMKVPEWEEVRGTDLFYIAGYALYPELWTEKTRDVCRRARESGIVVAMDSQLLPINTGRLAQMIRLDRVLPFVDLFFMAKKDAMELFGTGQPQECYVKACGMGFEGLLILKHGADGSYAVSQDGVVHIPAVGCEKTFDTVGAGDMYGASFCYAYLKRWSITTCGRFAAAYVANHIGEYWKERRFLSAAEAERLCLE